ncbi:MAG: UDP-2,3-diacylglucosamine diphosphatase, partial [Planctomycetota bacterium]
MNTSDANIEKSTEPVNDHVVSPTDDDSSPKNAASIGAGGESNPAPKVVRTLMISDVHLGCKHVQVDPLLDFLSRYQPQQIYLVGDFVDGWKMNNSWHWSESCDAIINHINQWAASGTRVYYTPGNHDDFLRTPSLRNLLTDRIRNVEIADEFVFQTAGGHRLLVTHGDLFDKVEKQAQWISRVSSYLYDGVLSLNRCITIRRGRNPYAVCGVLKSRVKSVVRWISKYDDNLMRHAVESECSGVVCGHVHTPTIKKKADSLIYLNTGDWIENCTGVVEYMDGRLCLESYYGRNKELTLKPNDDQDGLGVDATIITEKRRWRTRQRRRGNPKPGNGQATGGESRPHDPSARTT